jgi:two-component system OmpR family response regulator
MMPAQRILVVDDDETFRFIVCEVLVAGGFQVDLASNGQEARDAMDKTPCDAVLIDIMMPDTDGITLCREFRGRASSKNAAIFMVSALGDPHTVNASLVFGADDYFVKPVDPNLLVDKIKKRLDLRRRKNLRKGA